MEIINIKKFKLIFLCILILLPSLLNAEDANIQKEKDWFDKIDIYAKVISATIASIAVIFGLPLAVMNFRKTRAEIAKIKLETKNLEAKTVNEPDNNANKKQDDVINTKMISISNSPNSNIKIYADPRFLVPLLLLLDFIFAWILIILIDYLLELFLDNEFSRITSFIISFILFVPILYETYKARKSLRISETRIKT